MYNHRPQQKSLVEEPVQSLITRPCGEQHLFVVLDIQYVYPRNINYRVSLNQLLEELIIKSRKHMANKFSFQIRNRDFKIPENIFSQVKNFAFLSW